MTRPSIQIQQHGFLVVPCSAIQLLLAASTEKISVWGIRREQEQSEHEQNARVIGQQGSVWVDCCMVLAEITQCHPNECPHPHAPGLIISPDRNLY